MRLIVRTVVFSLLLLVAQSLAAQSLIFYQNTRTDAFLVKLNGGGPSQGITDHFIERLAASANKPAFRTEFVVAQDESVRLTKTSSTQYDVYVTVGNTRLTGDTQYKGFSMAAQLNPTGVQFTLQRIAKNGVVLESFPFNEVALTGDPVVIANFRATDTTGQFTETTIKVADKQILYAREAKGAFDQRTILIDDYYASITKLDALANDLRKVNPDDFEHIDQQQNDLNQYIRRLNDINSSDFANQLNLNASDPAGYLGKYQAVSAQAQDLNVRLSRTKAEIPERYHQRGLAFLQQNKPVEANGDFMNAVRLKPTFAPSHLELARLRYREGDIAGARARLLTIERDCQPVEEQTAIAARLLGNTIYQNHLSNADYAIKQKKFGPGLQSLSEARSLCTDLRLGCTPQLEDLTSLAHTGIFQSKVDSARLAMQANQLELAEAKAIDAVAYQKANPTYVKDPLPAIRIQNDAQMRIYQRFVVQANAFADQGKLTEAEAEARKALDYQSTHKAVVAEPVAANTALLRIKGLQYKDKINRAKSLAATQPREALPLLDAAIVIETEHAVTKDPTLWNLTQTTAKPVILEDLAKGAQFAKGNKLAEARLSADASKSWIEKYRLQADPDISKANEALRGAIFSQECANAQSEFDSYIKEADALRKQQKFIEASGAYDKGMATVGKQATCGIETRRAIEGKVEIASAVQYQQYLLDCQTLIDRNDSKVAIDTYNKAGDLAARENLLNRFGLTHASLFDYIMGSGKLEFIRYGAIHLTEKKDHDHAVELLHKAVQMGVAKSLVKDLMVRLGTELALRDKQADGSSDPKSKVLEYTRGNSKLATLGKAYLKARK